ncbi:MAG: two pore domain potassium channel family protein [Dehalococcoidales bacterium]|nr:two pore domain potassium channel family protein [Dehalococcoidales bacterium]
MNNFLKKLPVILVLPVLVLLIGTIGFILLEKLSFLNALYFTIVTVATVGYGDIHPITVGGKIFTIIVIFIGIGTFLTIVTNLTRLFISRGQERIRRQRLNMIIGVFFSEIGFELMKLLVKYDANVESLCRECVVNTNWTDSDFKRLNTRLQKYEYKITVGPAEMQTLRDFLKSKGEILLRQLENEQLLEHESFTELLWAIVHLRDELLARDKLSNLPKADINHIISDCNRIYSAVVKQWLQYLRHLKTNYPFLFSLALRTNPFTAEPSAVIKDTN